MYTAVHIVPTGRWGALATGALAVNTAAQQGTADRNPAKPWTELPEKASQWSAQNDAGLL